MPPWSTGSRSMQSPFKSMSMQRATSQNSSRSAPCRRSLRSRVAGEDRIVGYRDPKGLLAWLESLARGETDLDRVRKSLLNPSSDMRGRLTLARALLQAGRREEATDELVWLWQNIARVEPAMTGVRYSYLARDIRDPNESHAPAREDRS